MGALTLGASLSFTTLAETAKQTAEATVFSDAQIKQLMQQMVRVESGTFTMGSDEEQAHAREKPAHQVTLDSFYIGKTEVTQQLFERVMGWNVSYHPCAECPVNNISWMNIHAFLNKLNQATGKNFRLPTEAEWAFAAKGGNQSRGYAYSGSDNIDEVAWYAGNADRKSHPVGLKKPNELGLYDMMGNLWEFCLDDMNQRLYSNQPRVNPMFDAGKPVKAKAMKVTRGGGYEFDAEESKIYRRDGATSNVRMPDIGFRLAMDAEQVQEDAE
ncbi:MAG: SUMF1/EgtB/PvdO family nonheme iron enzyme [Candidatus Pelagadaptatus aseana]